MSFNISANFLLGAGLPLDQRTVVADLTARDAIPAIQRYDGLSVYVLSNNNTYQLQGGVTNGDWKIAMTAGGALWVDNTTYISPLGSKNVYTDGVLFISGGTGANPSLAFFDDPNTGLYKLTSGGKTIMNWCIDSDIVVQFQYDRITIPNIVKSENGKYFSIDGYGATTGPAMRIGNSTTLSNCRALEVLIDDSEVIDSGTSTSAGAATLTDNTKSWTVNAFATKQVYITSGTGLRDYRTIVSNTSDTLTVSENFSGVPSGSGYRIENKAVYYVRTDGGFFAGPDASRVDFPNAFCLISQDEAAFFEASAVKQGLMVENQTGNTMGAIAIRGASRIISNYAAVGIYGVVRNTADEGPDAIGLYGDVYTIRALGNNIGVYATASGLGGIVNYALYCANGAIRNSGRFLGKKGTDLTAANDMETTSGNYFEVDGSTTINRILYTESGSTQFPNWTAGSMITLRFTGSPTVSHGVATAGAYVGLQLSGSVDFLATPGDTLTLVLDATTTWWYETARTVI